MCVGPGVNQTKGKRSGAHLLLRSCLPIDITLEPSSPTKEGPATYQLQHKGRRIQLSPSPHPCWEAAEREGAGLFETPVLAVSSPFLIGINSEPVLDLLGKAGAGGGTDGRCRRSCSRPGMLSSESQCFGNSWSRKDSKTQASTVKNTSQGLDDMPEDPDRKKTLL